MFPNKTILAISALPLLSLLPSTGEHLDLDRFKQLREEERYAYQLAERAYQSGNMELALNEFDKFLRLYPNISAASFAQFMMGVCYQQHRHVYTAIKEYQKVVDYYPDSPEGPKAQWAIALGYERIGEPERAPAGYQKLIDAYPKHSLAAQALWTLSELHLTEGKPDIALQQRKRIVLEFEGHPLYRQAVDWLVVRYALEEKDPVAAREMSWRVRSKEDTEFYMAGLYRGRGKELRAGDKLKEGNEYLQRALEIYRNFGINFPKEYDRVIHCEFLVADCYLDMDKPQDAVKQYQEFPKRFPKEREKIVESEFLVVGCYLRMGKHEEAVKWLQEFPNRNPWATRHFPSCLKKIIEIYKSLEIEDLVRQWYALYLHKWPGDDGTRMEFGHYLEKPVGAWDEARSQYRKMENKFNGQWEVAASFHRQKKAEEAVKAYEDVLNSDFGRISIAYYQIGQVHQFLTQDYEKAIKAYTLSEYEPPNHIFRIAECYCAMQKWERALDTCREIINFFDGSRIPAMQFMVTSIYEVRNSVTFKDRESAVAVLKSILDHYPGTSAASWAHLKLEDYGLVVTGGGVTKD